MDAGGLVPDDVMVGIVDERLNQRRHRRGWILDGFPRTVGQAEALAEITGRAPVDVVVDLEVPADVVIERLSCRRTCVDLRHHLLGRRTRPCTAGSAPSAAATSSSATTTRGGHPPPAGAVREGHRSAGRPYAERGLLADRRRARHGRRGLRPACSPWSTRSGRLTLVLLAGDRATSAPPEQIAACGRPGGSWPRCTTATRAAIRPGVTTGDLDRIGREVLDRAGRHLELPRLPRLTRR